MYSDLFVWQFGAPFPYLKCIKFPSILPTHKCIIFFISFVDKLEAWNKPRDVKLPAIPIYDVDFERKRHGRKRKEKRTLRGNPPDFYKLNEVCESDRAAASTFLEDMRAWSSSAGKGLLINTVADPANPVEVSVQINPLYNYVSQFESDIEEIVSTSSDADVAKNIKEVLKVSPADQVLIQTHTLLQSRLSDWFLLRKFRITGSMVNRVCNYFKYKKANPLNIAKDIFQPSLFSSAAMKYGLEFEPVILDRYVTEKANAGQTITLKKIGLVVDTDHGFLAASPDSGVEDNGSLVGIVECKTAVKFSKKTISECINEASYPLKAVTINQMTHYELKESHAWYNQIQLQ